MITPDMVLVELERTSRGQATVRRVGEQGQCSPQYQTSNGWWFQVFDDAGAFDYIEAFAAPGEDWFDLFPEWPEGTEDPVVERFDATWGRVRWWLPSTEEEYHRWGFGPKTSPAGFVWVSPL